MQGLKCRKCLIPQSYSTKTDSLSKSLACLRPRIIILPIHSSFQRMSVSCAQIRSALRHGTLGALIELLTSHTAACNCMPAPCSGGSAFPAVEKIKNETRYSHTMYEDSQSD